MGQLRKPRLTYANVVATVALFVALGGVSWAALKIPKDSVGSKQIKNESVKANDLQQGSVGPGELQGNAVGFDNLAPDSVDSAKVKDGSIRYDDLSGEDVAPRLFAHVFSNGVLGDNAGASSVFKGGAGTYTVVFDRNLRGCVATASPGFGFSRSGGVDQYGRDSIATVSMNPVNETSQVRVETQRIDFDPSPGQPITSPSDASFHLIVAC